MLTVVRFVHYTGGAAWVGATLIMAVVVFPVLDRVPGRARAAVMRVLASRAGLWQTVAGLVVIGSGAGEVLLDHRLDTGFASLRTTWGTAIAVGLVCAVLMVILGIIMFAYAKIFGTENLENLV